jgi:carbonic anhydrase
MEKLIAGIHKFQQDELGRYQKLFRRLSREGQNPHTLFITCSDSRVLAELITQSEPGDLFVVKNVGNIVPSTQDAESSNSTAAAIEFAVEVLGVNDVVVCGHSRCGAMSALVNGSSDSMPHLQKWLDLADPVRKLIQRDYQYITDPEAKITAAAEENVLFGLENLCTYPAVMKRLQEGNIRLHGWFFNIATAEIFAYDPSSQQFQPIEKPS